ncbi:hypothetical protein DH2020_033875 [Rehmannia glutinosa]|uniref:Uncharacterized protein n=1 Tax=Rehmannia glutinosa TaxID=99300 RepID=A0ABR0VB07_REHGL
MLQNLVVLLMAKSKKLNQKSDPKNQGVVTLPKLPSRCMKVFGDARHEKRVEPPEKNEWDNALCSVCMEFPHNTVLLLCSSYEKGCRPYMCATSHRYSNCLEQYRNACTNVTLKQSKISELLLCPLCRGQVKGWTVVEPARRYLNAKKRTCLQDNCSFVGNFRELRKHVKSEHPLACPRDVDPLRAEEWKKLEDESGLSDAFSTVRSTMPGAIVIGDYAVGELPWRFRW